MAMVYGVAQKMIHTLENGNNQKLMAMEFINGKMEINMKASGTNVLNMAQALIFFVMVTLILANILMGDRMERVSIYFLMALHTWATLLKD